MNKYTFSMINSWGCGRRPVTGRVVEVKNGTPLSPGCCPHSVCAMCSSFIGGRGARGESHGHMSEASLTEDSSHVSITAPWPEEGENKSGTTPEVRNQHAPGPLQNRSAG